jgi:hypothetical protein
MAGATPVEKKMFPMRERVPEADRCVDLHPIFL